MPIIRKSEKRDYIWNTIGVLSQTATSPILLVLVSRFHGEEGLNIFSYLFALSLILWAINLWGGRTFQVSDIQEEFTVSGYLAVRLILAAVVLLIALGIGFIEGFPLETIFLLLLLTFLKVVEAVADTFFGILQSHEILFMAGKSLFYKAVLGIALFAIVDFYFRNLLFATIAIIFVNIVFLLFYDFRIARNLVKYQLSRLISYLSESTTILRTTWQIAVISIVANITLNIPRIVLAQYHEHTLGRFGAIALAVTATSLVITFVIQPKILSISAQFVAKEYKQFCQSVLYIFRLFAILGFVVLVVASLVGIPLLTFIFGLDFTGEHLPLIIIVLGGILNAIVLLFFNIFIIMRQTILFLWMLILTNLILILISIWLVSSYSILGATIAYAICTLIQSILSAVMYKRKIYIIRKMSNLNRRNTTRRPLHE